MGAKKGDDRLADNICLRITTKQRRFLEEYSDKIGVGVCEGMRRVLDTVMALSGEIHEK